MKKRILALLLAFSMMLSLLPVSALADTGGGIDFAAYASNEPLPDLVMGNNGIPDTSNAASRTEDNKTIWYGTDWTYDGDTLTLESGSYDFTNTKPITKGGDALTFVQCRVVVENGATITGGHFRAMSNYGTVENSLLSSNDIENCDGGTMTNCLFSRSTLPKGVANYHKLTEVNNNAFDATLPNAPYIFSSCETYYFTGTPKLVVRLSKYGGGFDELHYINGEEHYNDLTGPDSGYYTFTPIAGDDIVLNRKDYVTNLVITADGIPVTTGRAPIYQDNNSSNPIIGYKGDGWTYMLNSVTNEKGVLTLMQRSNHTIDYTFSDSSWNQSTAIECDVTVKDSAQILNGVFHGAVTLNASAVASESIFTGTVTLEGISNQISWSYFGKNARLVCSGNELIRYCVFAGDTSGYTFSTDTQDCLFASEPTGLTTDELRTEDDKEFSATLYSAYGKCPEKLTGQKMYVQRSNKLVATRTDKLPIINGIACTADWSGWYYPSDTILKRNYHLTVENGTLNDTTPAQGDFGSGTSITVQANAPTDTDTFFAGWKVTPADTKLMKGNAPVDLTQSNITFDMPIAPEGLTLTATYAPYVTDLVMTTGGIPDITNVAGGKDGTHFSYKGDGWTFTGAADISDAIGTLTLKNTNSYDFSCLDPLKGTGGELAAVKCPLINDGATIKDGVFKNLVINHSGTISGGTFAVDLASINSEDFSTSGTVTGGAFNGKDGLSDGAHAVTVKGGSIRKVNDTEPLKAYEINDAYGLRYGIVPSAEWNLYSYEGTILTVTADTEITNINGWDIGKFRGSSYPNGADDKKTVRFQMPDGPVVLNATLYTLEIIRGTMMGNTSVSAPAGTELILDADEPAKNETFLGWTLSDESLLKDGTLNDPECTRITIKMKAASATAEAVFQKDTPAYTLTVTGGGLVNGKTSAVVEAGDEVRLTTGEMQEGMSFNYWDLPTALIKALMDKDSTFSNKVENLTFTMPDLSKYTEDTRFTIRLDIRPAELPDDDDGPSVLGTMATVAVGGAAAGILVWQGVSLGVDSYLQLSLPGGVPVPTNRRELVKLLWETAGKPDVVLPALYGDVSAEDGELQKATRWAIDNGLVKPADESDASRFDPDRSVSKYEVARAWFKVQQMLK